MCEKPRLKGTKSVISTFLDVCMALLTLDFETSNKVDRTLFDRPDFNLNKKIPIVVATVLAGVFLIDNSTAFKSAKKFDTEMPKVVVHKKVVVMQRNTLADYTCHK
ncbi:hypothetical protein DPMN_065123 [Dreissena polymorpha]|uniref:Uncharacterized protein n=1 Tax=Dreissena polymorpha TaxID=45954 RepID=A0A9D4CE06_DREPO|nr:hypothetical protein DPMN_065123 [Dreissena polymorpha]